MATGLPGGTAVLAAPAVATAVRVPEVSEAPAQAVIAALAPEATAAPGRREAMAAAPRASLGIPRAAPVATGPAVVRVGPISDPSR